MLQSFKNPSFIVLLVLLASPIAAAEGPPPIHHDLKITLSPETNSLEARAMIRMGSGVESPVRFYLHRDLTPQTSGGGSALKEIPSGRKQIPADFLTRYELSFPAGTDTITLVYKGKINHPLDDGSGVPVSGVHGTPGLIGPEGVFLAGISGWYPSLEIPGDPLLTFSAEVTLPKGWASVSQGMRTLHRENESGVIDRWESPEAQEEIYMIAAPFMVYERKTEHGTALAFLRTPDPDLAERYLEATEGYLDLYSRMLGPYPYKKFALVENFWETGFGMPSFTLLGSRVIRLPFILHSSYPHEILHNWWGNGVYMDPKSGNWSEGLTSYLADHFFQEKRGGGAEYRRAALQKYTDYVSSDKDFALTEFRGRNNPATEAVGYGKTLMFFHMLRRQLGDERFLEGLQSFYKAFLFKQASFADLRKAFEDTGDGSLETEFQQWTEGPGAPRLRLKTAGVEADEDGFRVRGVLEQKQKGAPYTIQVPAVVTLEGEKTAFRTFIPMNQKTAEFEIPTKLKPLRLDIDPEFDLFRRLHPTEVPPALTQMIGAAETLFILPSAEDPENIRAYEKLGLALGRRLEGRYSVVSDAQVPSLPTDRTIWILGWKNRFAPIKAPTFLSREFSVTEIELKLGEKLFEKDTHSIVTTVRHPGDPGSTMGWIASEDPAAVSALARKIPHYGRFGLLLFEGSEAKNVVREKWPVLQSALSISLTEDPIPPRGRIPSPPPLGKLF
ncbi:MAG TPA: M1 family aminopeptidase [Nitrospiria bacterium]